MVKRLVVDRRSNVFSKAIDSIASRRRKPRDWHDVISALPQLVGFTEITDRRYKNLLNSEATYLSWGPELSTVLAATLGRNLTYLCWGTPGAADSGPMRFLKKARLKWIVKRAQAVLVNDSKTKEELKLLSGRDPVTVPYLVDTDFYSYCGQHGRESFVIVPGDKDRDDELICQLAANQVRVIRVSRNDGVRRFYEDRCAPNLVQIRIGISYEELKELYQRAKAVLIPSVRQDHAVGQTTILEAIACGAPVVISAGRTAALFEDFPTVTVCESRKPDDWLAKLRRLDSASPLERELAARAASDRLALSHHPRVIEGFLVRLLAQMS